MHYCVRWLATGQASAPMSEALFAGFLTGLSLIAAIGAQNAFVLRQGLRREYVGLVVLLCAGSDAILIAAGVAGFGAVAGAWPGFGLVMRWLGAGFLLLYGLGRMRSALRGASALQAEGGAGASRRHVAVTCLLLTWANPHVWLDTVVLLGAVATRYAPFQAGFALGAMLASLSFFPALGFGARLLAPLFARPAAWRWLDLLVALVMWGIALHLLSGA